MARLARAEVFNPSEVAVLHLCARVVRRCFLFGVDPVTGKNHDHRKIWIEDQLRLLAANFGIDLLSMAVLSNHFHLILRSRPDVVETWDDSEVARRWLMLCPKRKKPDKSPEEPNEFELNSIRSDPEKLATIRKRLSDVAWWMRLLCQNIGTRANQEDKQVGKFFQGRYRAVRILDEESLLACAAYVDLNPIRAALAETLESSQYTSDRPKIPHESGYDSQLSKRRPGTFSKSMIFAVSNVASLTKAVAAILRSQLPIFTFFARSSSNMVAAASSNGATLQSEKKRNSEYSSA